MTGLALLAALIGVLAAVAFLMQSRGARAEADAAKAEVEGARAQAAAAQKALAEQKVELRERREEASTLKQQLEAVKKKAFEQAEAQKKAGGAPALREELEKLTRRLGEARVEADHQAELARSAEAARAKAVAEAERSKAALDRKLAEPLPVAPVPPDVEELRTRLGGELAAEKARADQGEARALELRKKLSEVEKEVKVQKGRIETERRVYMVTKGELDLAQDRYAELKRRNDSLRKEHQELIDAVRQAAREERALAEKGSRGATPAPAPVEAPAADAAPAAGATAEAEAAPGAAAGGAAAAAPGEKPADGQAPA
jgi:chromosome segregation ATPase